MKKVLKWVMIVVLSLIVLVGGFLTYLTIFEYRPKKVEAVDEVGQNIKSINLGEEMSILIFNTGYASLGKDEDFVMDGGKMGRPKNKEVVEKYLSGIKEFLAQEQADFYLLQEVDYNSRRSYNTHQVNEYHELFADYNYTFALNYKAKFVPFPFSFTDYIGRVNSGIQTLSQHNVKNAFRHQLPGAFSWPIRTVNLKRAMLVNYYEINGSDKLLVVVNVHLSAYDDGSMRKKEMDYLKAFLIAEQELGNYIIIGGDFNQTFKQIEDVYPVEEGLWTPPIIDDDFLPAGFSFFTDATKPSCRLLNKPYTGIDHQYYIIDGFIVSSNISVIEVINHDLDFEHSDHNPITLKVVLN